MCRPNRIRESTGKVSVGNGWQAHAHIVGIVILAVLLSKVGNCFHVEYQPPRYRPVEPKMTLRDILLHPDGFHLALAPAFFGFYGYFGALAAWEDQVDSAIFEKSRVKSVAGASAGAMAAILLSAGVSPNEAAVFCSNNVTLSKFADFPALLALFRGNAFQKTIHQFLREARPHQSLLIEDAVIPVAVSAFDLQTLQGRILQRGSMARAARASATFPILFQPVGWKCDDSQDDYVLIDGGIGDIHGWKGLGPFVKHKSRIIHIQMGTALYSPPGPSAFRSALSRQDIDEVQVISILLTNLPQPGPWALEKGPVALEMARKAMSRALDQPMRLGKEDRHLILEVDASSV
ncbi:hypothetical protein FisN_24Hh238 [Fistulifera solaris]|uniref:PNPLA domain-containing protein n=1 Tax=Fistulifera solaris TaxID=1519565 RepID=A0A1Z5K2X0_FISSO|nr:hypothetical protein FisN_24Hh238 [Fistulifera solaris]|eukprot:GAX20512.1 hypothetical protein FisN_24Hh238 [Fistulifera solaris]